LLFACLICSASVEAQTYPTRPIKVIVPMQAGTAGDSIMRIVAEQIAANIGQPLVIENVAGAAGEIGAERIAHAPPDGYTIGAMSDSMLSVVPHLQPRISYEPLDGFAPVGFVASITSVLVVNASLPVRNVNDLVALAKLHPGALDFASGGNGSQQHLAMAIFSDATGISLNHIPFRGASQAAMEVVAGRIPVMFVALSIALPFIKDGRLRAIAVASKGRSALLPDVPTVSESGLPGFVFTPWVAIYAPKGTPTAIVDRLHRETLAAVQNVQVRNRFLALGLESESLSPDELNRRTRDDYARMGKLIKASGIKSE
jgi:tripartite-type tricarboxylate transporter receptor subunit TctC